MAPAGWKKIKGKWISPKATDSKTHIPVIEPPITSTSSYWNLDVRGQDDSLVGKITFLQTQMISALENLKKEIAG